MRLLKTSEMLEIFVGLDLPNSWLTNSYLAPCKFGREACTFRSKLPGFEGPARSIHVRWEHYRGEVILL